MHGVTVENVRFWRDRYISGGLSALKDKPRSGRPAQYKKEFENIILSKLEERPPTGYGQWDGEILAKETGYSKHAIWRFLRTKGICLARKRSWCISTDPEFASKSADIVGLYLAPPENALVICIDEKPNIQALEQKVGYAVSSDKKLVHAYQSTYKRKGTLNLFAALEVATGHISAKITESSKKQKKGLLSFWKKCFWNCLKLVSIMLSLTIIAYTNGMKLGV